MAETLSQRIRKAALGPEPIMYAHHLWGWLDPHSFNEVARVFDLSEFRWSSNVHRRMFLLFIAEAIDD